VRKPGTAAEDEGWIMSYVYDPERDFSDVVSECRIDRRLILKRVWMAGVTNHLNSNTPWQPPVATTP